MKDTARCSCPMHTVDNHVVRAALDQNCKVHGHRGQQDKRVHDCPACVCKVGEKRPA